VAENRATSTNAFLEVARFGCHCRSSWKLSRLYTKKLLLLKINYVVVSGDEREIVKHKNEI
jgi:hypothetical protein